MKTFIYHYKGIEATFRSLFAGKFLIYFIPGGIITLVYLFIQYRTSTIEDTIDLETGYNVVDKVTGVLKSGISYVFDFFDFIVEQIYIYVVITLLAPFNTILAEKFDSDLTGKKFESTWLRYLNDMIRMVFVAIIALLLELGFMLLYWMFSWLLPDIIDPIMYHLIAAFFFGFAYFDFHLERYEIGVLGSLGYAFENILTMLLTGTIFLLIYKIPVIGIPLAPVLTVMISCVVYLYKAKILPVKRTTTELETKTENV